MDKKYQIFISSTYIDLIDERKRVADTISKAHHIPVGMELFPASTLKQWEMIKSLIDTSDYYILIIGSRYGTIAPVYENEADRKISYTQKEYEYAFQSGVPIYTFFRQETEPLSDEKKEKTEKKRKKLESFKKSIKGNGYYYEYWTNPFELSQNVLNALNFAFKDCPRPGWKRELASDADPNDNPPGKETSNAIGQLLQSQDELLSRFMQGNWRNTWELDGKNYYEIAKITVEGNYLVDGFQYFKLSELKYSGGKINFKKAAIQVGDNRLFFDILNVESGDLLVGNEKVGENHYSKIVYERSLPNCLYKNESLKTGECLLSGNKEYKLYMQHDGNLVLYNARNEPIWASHTDGQQITQCVLMDSGNLVLMDSNDTIKWESNSRSYSANLLWLQNDGNLVICKMNGRRIWDRGN